MDGAHARPPRRAGDVRRGRRLRLPRRARLAWRPRWMQERGLEWIYRTAQEPRRLLGRYLRTNPRFVVAFARQYLAERRRRRLDWRPWKASPSSAWAGSACRSRSPSPIAASSVIGVEREPACSTSSPPGEMPFQETGTQELLERVLATGRFERTPRRAGRRRRPTTSCSRSARPRTCTSRSTCRRSAGGRRPAAGAARGPLADPALDRRARHDRLGGRLHRAAARLPRGRGPVRRARARAHRREPLPRGDRDAAAASSAASARARVPGRPSCSRCSAPRSSRPRRCRPSWPRSGRTSCATPSSRCPTC